MKLNTKNIVALMALGGTMAFAPALLAQDASTNAPAGGPPAGAPGGGQMRGQNADQMVQRLTTRLNLTTDEQAKVKPIIENQMQQMMAIRQDQDPQDRRTKMIALRQETMTNMETVLTSDQFAQYQQMMQRRRPMGQGGPGGNTNAPSVTPPPAPAPPQQ
jgi:protein CpxP